MASCRSCNVPMIWATSPNNRPLPLDARPVETLVERGVISQADADKATRYRTEAAGEELHAVKSEDGAYISHWVTCVTRDQHVKR